MHENDRSATGFLPSGEFEAVADRFFATEKRKFIVADTPGHEQYTRNMATGASTADLAVLPVDARVPDPQAQSDPVKREGYARALDYMGLSAGQAITDIAVDRVFIGSCTNSRIEDLRAAAEVVRGRQKAASVKQVLVVPGSGQVKAQAEGEGLDKVFIAAGREWREPGGSMCLAMNADRLGSGEHCASTSNRNFEGRQGYGGRTHLVSPAMAAAAAIAGHFVDVRDFR